MFAFTIAISESDELIEICFFMQTHQMENAGQLCFMCEVRFHAPRPPHATQLLKQQQHVA